MTSLRYYQPITVQAPATIANLVCGFDVLGLAITNLYDVMTLELLPIPTIIITHTDNYNLPTEATQNVAGVALLALQAAYCAPIGFKLTITKNIKPGSGLGSSSASAVGAVVAANYLLQHYFTPLQITQFALKGEAFASGSAIHADNVAPCQYGGITLIPSCEPLHIIQLTAPPLYITIIHPQIEIKTSEARAILPKTITLQQASTHWGNVGGLVAGLLQGNYSSIAACLNDAIIEPVRSTLIPYYNEVKTASLQAGALGGGISGSGPSIFMLSSNRATAELVAQAMHGIYANCNIAYNVYTATVNPFGVSVVG